MDRLAAGKSPTDGLAPTDRLGAATLDRLPAAVRVPRYRREALGIGMAHLGVGAFHRCHQCEFTDDMLEARFDRFGVVGINLCPPRLGDSLAPQDGLFTRTLRQSEAAEIRVIGCIKRVIDADGEAGAEAAVAALASPDIDVVTMTLTEKGYCHVPATGMLDPGHAGLAADLVGAWPPQTAIGLLARALERRRATAAGPITLVSCDNVPANGLILERVLTAFAKATSGPLAAWIAASVAFPSTMVDRIVPASGPDDRAFAAACCGVADQAAVVGEPFRQWVIEDRFAGRRPPWDLAGAEFVADVAPYELVKMRLLNAAQSTLSHLGAILGHAHSHEAARDPLLARLVRAMLVEETVPTLPDLPSMPALAYVDSTFARIANVAIQHRCHQIGTDGSQKIVQRILNPLRERRAAGAPADLLTLAAASWLAYVAAGAAAFGARWEPRDPFAAAVIGLADRHGGDIAAFAAAALAIEPVFGRDLAVPAIAEPVARHVEGLLGPDPRAYLAGIADGSRRSPQAM